MTGLAEILIQKLQAADPGDCVISSNKIEALCTALRDNGNDLDPKGNLVTEASSLLTHLNEQASERDDE